MRTTWDEYFMGIAEQVATRSTCDRASVGCVVVRDKTIVSTGYNGSMRGKPHCDDVGHLMQDGHCVRTVHAEQNAIAQAAKNGASINDATAYITHCPCWVCFKLLVNAGVKRIMYRDSYRVDPLVQQAFQDYVVGGGKLV
jgi:dCMP deaminase